jgi:hypothetical protein
VDLHRAIRQSPDPAPSVAGLLSFNPESGRDIVDSDVADAAIVDEVEV